MSVCVCARVLACVRACLRACVRACGHVCVRACGRASPSMRAYARGSMFGFATDVDVLAVDACRPTIQNHRASAEGFSNGFISMAIGTCW